MRLDRIIIGLFAGFVVAVAAAILLIVWKEETTEVNLATGEMRMRSEIVGSEPRFETIENGSNWRGDRTLEDKWVAFSVVEHRLLTGQTFKRRIGMVYVDAVTVATALFVHDDAARAAVMTEIYQADPERIWQVRSRLRERFQAMHPTPTGPHHATPQH